MRKILGTMAAAAILAASAIAQDAEGEDEAAAAGGIAPLLGHFSFKTEQPAGVVGALDAMMAACGGEVPAVVSLFAEQFNGADDTTHTAIFSYAEASAVEQTGIVFQTCAGANSFNQSANALSKPTGQYLGQTLLSGGNALIDQAFTVFRLEVSDEAAYGEAFRTFMEAVSDDLPGSYGLVRIIGGASDAGTHYAFFGGPDTAAVLAANDAISAANSDDRRRFNRNVREIRRVIDTRITYRVKNYNVPAN
ncbi:MAG: hypothetical protein AAFX03_01760 [Pseudomonadota bacterium]